MSLSVFETEDATYHLGLGNHARSGAPIFSEMDWRTIDMLVLEDSPEHPLDRLVQGVQYNELYRTATRENPRLRVYGVDLLPAANALKASRAVDFGASGAGIIASAAGGIRLSDHLKRKRAQPIPRRKFVCDGLLLAGGALFGSRFITFLAGMQSDAYMPVLDETNTVRTTLLPLPHLGFRDAVVAKKVAEYLVPQHKPANHKIGVALMYGHMHTGIESKIKHAWLRDATLWLYKDSFGYCTRKDGNEVRELVREGRTLKTRLYDCGLF